MGRTPGAPNKSKNISPTDINKYISSEIQYSLTELEDIFLSNALEQYKFFKRQADRLRKAGQDPALCEQYAEAYKLIVNRFTYVPDLPNEEEEGA